MYVTSTEHTFASGYGQSFVNHAPTFFCPEIFARVVELRQNGFVLSHVIHRPRGIASLRTWGAMAMLCTLGRN